MVVYGPEEAVHDERSFLAPEGDERGVLSGCRSRQAGQTGHDDAQDGGERDLHGASSAGYRDTPSGRVSSASTHSTMRPIRAASAERTRRPSGVMA